MASGFTNAGLVELTAINASGTTAALTVTSGTLVNAGTGTIASLPGAGGARTLTATVNNQGTFTVDQALTLSAGTITNGAGGVMQGTSTVNLTGTTLTNNGDMNPGTSPGILGLTGAFAQPSGVLNIELGGLTVGTQYDRLTVSGAATLGGTLDVTLIGAFAPMLGDQFTVLTYGSHTGSFSGVNLPPLSGGLTWQTTANPTAYVLEVVGPPPQILWAGDSLFGASKGQFRANPDGSGLFRITTEGPSGRDFPRWSPDRTRYTYTSNNTPGATNLLHVGSVDGLQLAHVVNDTSTQRAAWNSTGTHLAAACGPSFSPNDVCVVANVSGPIASLNGLGDGSGKTFVTDFDLVNRPDGPGSFHWDPLDPNRLAVVRNDSAFASRIFTVRFDGTSVVPLSPDSMDVGGGVLEIYGPMDWSPDGSQLVFSAYDTTFFQHLYLINRNGTGLVQLTSGSAYDDDPVFSPDGQEVLFRRNFGCSVDFWAIHVSGSNERQLTAEGTCDYDSDLLGADWSPDGLDIAVTGFDPIGTQSNQAIYTIKRTTTAATYAGDRVLVGRGSSAIGEVRDIQPNWRP